MKNSSEVIASMIRSSRNVVAFTGAGMSTESGLKDFRSQNGMWAGKDPMQIASTRTIRPRDENETLESYLHRITEFHEFYKWRIDEVEKFRPNRGHDILAKWQHQHYVKGVITQNVDGYHQKAGSEAVITLHGDLMSTYDSFTLEPIPLDQYKAATVPCLESGGIMRPGIVLFGEGLDKNYNRAIRLAKGCDLLIVMGTSLNVSPANLIPLGVVQQGGRVVIINREPTEYDHVFDLVVNDRDIGTVLAKVERHLNPTT